MNPNAYTLITQAMTPRPPPPRTAGGDAAAVLQGGARGTGRRGARRATGGDHRGGGGWMGSSLSGFGVWGLKIKVQGCMYMRVRVQSLGFRV